MLESVHIPTRVEARTQAEVEAIDVTSVQDGDLIYFVMSPVAVLVWQSGALGVDASLGIIKPASRSVGVAGRWVFSHWIL